MKRILPLFFLMIFLASCALPGSAPGNTEADMQTQVASILTQMPPSESTPATGGEPTGPAVSEVTLEATVTETPTETLTPEPTLTATDAPTSTPEATATPEVSSTPETPTNTAAPTFTAVPGDPRAKLGAATSTDTMESAERWTWPTGPNDFTGLGFANGNLTLTGLTEMAGWRLPITDASTNMYIEMTATAPKCNSPEDNYGIIFRVPVFKEADRGYLFAVSCEGKYALWKWDGQDGEDGKATMLVQWVSNPAIISGAGQTNRLGVWTVENRIMLYANGALLIDKSDSSYTNGAFGIFVNPKEDSEFAVQITEMSYWLNVKP